MTERLILLPGWGLGSLPLDVLAEALRGLDPALRVEIEPLPEGFPGFWVSSPVSIVHLVCKEGASWE